MIQLLSCSFNDDDNTLYITMYNLIWVIKDSIDFSYLYFKDKAITSALYDNNFKKLIINFSDTKSKQLGGSISELSKEEIIKMAIPLTNITSTFNYSKKEDNPSIKYLNPSDDENITKGNKQL